MVCRISDSLVVSVDDTVVVDDLEVDWNITAVGFSTDAVVQIFSLGQVCTGRGAVFQAVNPGHTHAQLLSTPTVLQNSVIKVVASTTAALSASFTIRNVYDCERDFGTVSTILESRGYIEDGQLDYQSDADCSWILAPADASDVSLYFEDFATESGLDVVLVYSCTDSTCVSKTQLGEFSGQSLPSTLKSETGVMKIDFTSNFGVEDRGFRARFEAGGGSHCDKVQSSVVEIPRDSSECTWVENNLNDVDEIMLSDAPTREACLEQVLARCPTATIANYQDGGTECFCQFGTDMTPMSGAGWLSCLVGAVATHSCEIGYSGPVGGECWYQPPYYLTTATGGMDIVYSDREQNGLVSKDGNFKMILHQDGTLAVYDSEDDTIWSNAIVDHCGECDTVDVDYGSDKCTCSTGTGPYQLKLQHDGNLEISNAGVVWKIASHGVAPTTEYHVQYRLILQCDGTLVAYDTNDDVYWTTHVHVSGRRSGGGTGSAIGSAIGSICPEDDLEDDLDFAWGSL